MGKMIIKYLIIPIIEFIYKILFYYSYNLNKYFVWNMNINIKNYNKKMPVQPDHYHNKQYDEDIKSGHIKK